MFLVRQTLLKNEMNQFTYSAASLASFWHQKTVYASSFYLSPLAVA